MNDSRKNDSRQSRAERFLARRPGLSTLLEKNQVTNKVPRFNTIRSNDLENATTPEEVAKVINRKRNTDIRRGF